MLTELELLSGKDFVTSNGLTFKHPKLSDLQKYETNIIYGFTNLFCLEPQDLMAELWKQGIDFEFLTPFDLFIMLYYSNQEQYNLLFKDFAGIAQLGAYEQDGVKMMVAGDEDFNPIGYIDETVYKELSKFYKTITCFENKEKMKFAGQKTKEAILDLEVENMEDNKEEGKDQLAILLSAIVWGNTSGYNWTNIWDLYFYQFNTGIKQLDKIKYTSSLLNGVYAGNVDTKKINRKELDWKLVK